MNRLQGAKAPLDSLTHPSHRTNKALVYRRSISYNPISLQERGLKYTLAGNGVSFLLVFLRELPKRIAIMNYLSHWLGIIEYLLSKEIACLKDTVSCMNSVTFFVSIFQMYEHL